MCSTSGVQTSVSNDDANLIKDLCIKNVPFWNIVNYEDIEIDNTPLSLTNKVFIVRLKSVDCDRFPYKNLIVKKRTKFTDLTCNYDLQYNVSKILGDNNCGPRLIGRFSDFIIQEFIEGSVMKTTSFHNLSVVASLASSLAKFHKKGTEISPIEWDRTPFVIRQINKWSEHVDRIIKKHNLDFDFNELISSFETYKNLIESHIKTSNSIANSVLFCHNDLFYNNILDIQHGVFLIDFDFSGFNYVGWELSNFFNNFCPLFDSNILPYFSYDESLEFSYEFKSFFVAVYLSQLLEKNVSPSDNVVKEFLDSLEVHYLGVELFWMLLDINGVDKPATESSVPFDFYEASKIHHKNFKDELNKLREQKLVEH